MEFENEFDVEAPIDEVYSALLQPDRVAPAMPGAQVLEKVDDDNYKVAIKVKVGPVSMQYRGDVQVVDKDPDSHSATMNVKARESRGQGTATANVQMGLTEAGAGRTHGKIHAEVQLAGKAASMGRGIIQDVSSRLVQQFAANLATMLGTQEAAASTNGGGAVAEPEKAEPDTPPAASGSASGADAAPSGGETKEAEPAPKAEAPKAEAPKEPPAQAAPPAQDDDAGIDMLPLAASIARDRLGNPAVIAVVVALLLGFLLGRGSKG
jgi:carbon monoxide dehydrogenase subunit G